MLFSGKAFARSLFIGFIAVSLLVGLFSIADYARGQALQAKWEAAAKQTAGRDPIQWWLSRSLNADKTHKGIFAGVDLTYIYEESRLHANLALVPRTKLDTVQFQFDDLQSLSIDGNGEAFVQTAFGNFRLSAPTFSQELNGQEIPLSGGYQQSAKGTLGFWSGYFETNRALRIRFSMEVVQQKAAVITQPRAPEVVTIGATKVDSLFNDVDGDTKADPGDTLEYEVTISNSGDEDATGVQFNDTIDANTTLVPGSVDTTPLAINDSYSAVGNVRIQVPAGSGLITNDTEPDGTGGLTITAETKLSANNGNVTINADGSFTYNPFPGFEGADTFTYTLNDGESNTDTGTATVTVSGMIWFINDSATPPGDGRLTSPFSSIANFNSTAADATGENIFIFESANPYTGPPTLLNNQRLIGQDSTSTLSTITGITPPTFSDPFPATNSANGIIVNITSATNGVNLAQDNTLNGFTVGNSLIAVNGTLFGTLTVADVIINTNGQALSLNNGTAAGPGFISTTSTGGTNNVSFTSQGGTLNLGSGALSGATSHAFIANQGPGSINYSGTINNTTARSLSVTNKFAGTVTFAGAVSGTSQGLFIDGNSGTATINFTGGINLSTGANAAFTATGGGTVNATQNNTTIVNTLTTTTGTALNVDNTTIGASNLTFRSISSNGGSNNGIILNNIGAGGLIVSGNGSSGTGGTIANKTGADGSTTLGTGIFLTNTSNVSLSWMQLNDFQNFGIRGTNVSGFTLNNSVINATGAATNGTTQGEGGIGEGSIRFDNLTGSATISNSTVTHGVYDNIGIFNTSGSLNRITVSNTTLATSTNMNTGNDAFRIEAFNAGTIANLTFDNDCDFTASRGDLLDVISQVGSTIDVEVIGNDFSNNHSGIASGGGGIIFHGQGTMTFDIQDNDLQGARGRALNVSKAALNGVFSGTINNNRIGVSGVPLSGSTESSGIFVDGGGAGSMTVSITNNVVREYNEAGLFLIANNQTIAGNNATMHANITGNTTAAFNGMGTFAFAGVWADIGTGVNGDTSFACLDIGGAGALANDFSAGDPFNAGDINLSASNGSTIRLPGYLGPNNNVALITAYLTGRNLNPATTAVSLGFGTGTGTMTGGSACLQPPLTITDLTRSSKDLNASQKQVDLPSNWNGTKLSNSFVEPAMLTTQRSGVFPVSRESNLLMAQSTVNHNQSSLPISDEGMGPLSGETINLNIGTLPFGKSITVKFRATIDNPFPQGVGQVCNQATISGSNFSNVLSDDPDVGGSADPTCTTLAQADLAVTKTDSPDPVSVGNNITYTINFVNNGPDGATNVNVTDATPVNTTFVSATVITGTGWTVGDPGVGGTGNVTFDKAAVAAAETATFEIVVQTDAGLPDGTIISNTVITTSETPDGNTADNGDTETTLVQAPADLAVTKTDSPDPVIAGNNITYTINFVNNGPNASSNVSVTDATPANTTFVSASVISGTGWSTTTPAVGGTGTISFDKALVATSETATFEIVVKVNANTADATIISNTVDATATTLDNDTSNNTDTETTTVQARADLAVTKSDSPDPVVAGTNLTYTIDFVNNGPSQANAVSIADAVPANTTFVSASAPAGWITITPPVGGTGTITFTKATVLAGETAQFMIVVNVNANTLNGTIISNSATASSATQDDIPGNNTGTATTTVIAQADLSITKSDTPDPVDAGANITYTLDFANAGPSDAQGVSITDATPANTTFVSASAPAGWTTNTPPVGGTGTVTFSNPTVAAGEIAQFTIVVNVNSDTADGSTISNTADVTSATTDTNSGNNSDTETTDVQTSADLSITKTDSADPVAAGTNLTYTLDFTNNGPSDAQNVDITDAVPANTTFVSASAPAGWTSTTPPVGGTGNVLFEKTTVSAGETAQFTIVVAIAADVPDATVISNTATVASDTTDPDTANNSDTETTTVNASSDLAVTKVDSVDPATAGQNLTYTITFANNGPSDAQNVDVSDPLPAFTTFVSAQVTNGTGWTITSPPVGGTGAVSFTKATSVSTETATFEIVVLIDPATPDNTILSNTVTATSDSADPNPGNDSATETTLVREPSDLSITKDDGVTDVSPGQSITYTIIAGNVGRDDPAAVVADDLPSELLNVTWTCVGVGGGTCTSSGTGDINETVNLPDGGSVTFTVNAVIDFGATNQIINTATITPGPGITDPDLSNNTATDTDTILCLFCEEFDDSMLDPNWTYLKSINPWSEDGNNLVGSSSGNTTATAENVFAGCSTCTVFTSMMTSGGTFSRISLFAWFIDKKNTGELVMRQDKGRWVFKHKVAGTVVAKGNVSLPILANTAYNVRITFTGTEFQVFIDGSATPNITVTAVQQPNGSVGFKVKGTSGTFDFLRVF